MIGSVLLFAAVVGSPQGPDLEDPTGLALHSFYEALGRTEDGVGKTRVLHMGDSTIGLDGVPHAIRRRMQDRFGDGGAGFVPMSLATLNLRNHEAEVHGGGWDICYIGKLCRKDGHYGLAGYVHRARSGAWSKVATRKGRSATAIELWYAALPHGGKFRVRVDGERWETIETAGDGEDRWHRVEVASGQHAMEVRTLGPGRVQTYGFVVENAEPGVVWDTVSMWGAFTKRVKGFDAEHIASQVSHRDPDLLVLNYGGNDMRRIAAGIVDGPVYKEELRAALRILRAGKPTLACVVASVVDHVRSGGRRVEPADVLTMVNAQRQVAYEEGCAFFDSVAAMGGPGSLMRWARRRPRLVAGDLVHLSGPGRDLMGQMMFRALERGYDAFALAGRGVAK